MNIIIGHSVNTVLIRLASEIFHSVYDSTYIMAELNATVTESEASTVSLVRGSLYGIMVFVSIVLVPWILYRLLYASKAIAEVRWRVTV